MALDTISTGTLEALDDQLIKGVPTLGWPGDPNLQVELGQVVAGRSGFSRETGRYVQKGDLVAQRIEVWRHTEQHGRQRLGHWRMDELPNIIPDLVKMDPSRPRHVGVEESIDAHNAAIQAKLDDQHRDSLGAMMEHAQSLAAQRRLWTPGIAKTWNPG